MVLCAQETINNLNNLQVVISILVALIALMSFIFGLIKWNSTNFKKALELKVDKEVYNKDITTIKEDVNNCVSRPEMQTTLTLLEHSNKTLEEIKKSLENKADKEDLRTLQKIFMNKQT